jgi:hypothetical protein
MAEKQGDDIKRGTAGELIGYSIGRHKGKTPQCGVFVSFGYRLIAF